MLEDRRRYRSVAAAPYLYGDQFWKRNDHLCFPNISSGAIYNL